jgi:hypothetical protein
MATPRFLIALAGAAVVTGATACEGASSLSASSVSVTATKTSTSSLTTAPATTTVASSPSACDDLGGQVGPDQICTVHTEIAGYTIDMSFPVTYPDQPAVATVLKRQRDPFVETVSQPPVRDVPKALDIKSTSYASGPPDARTESLVLEEYVNVGGAHPETYYDALNYDLAKKSPITFETLFKPGADPVAVLDPLVETDLRNRLQGAPVNANPVGAEMYRNFALTDDAVIFFVGQGLWTIEAAGAQEVSVPRSELASILA